MASAVDFSIMAIFLPTFFFVSVTPGMCMTLAMSLGMSIGLKRTFYMMAGELVGVAIVALSSVIGVAAIMINHPDIFTIFKYAGGLYLGYLGLQLWLNRGKMALSKTECSATISAASLATQGFVTAIANPKGWAFFIALLPPFINQTKPLIPQVSVLLAIILVLEFICLIIYASGGSTMRKFLQKSNNVRLMNRIAGTLMLGVGVWLAFG
ncbi:LysE family translocator [Sulfurospirillum diekertiae]|uniref:Homoserine/homoserine lactone efflux protein n=1 Tax=Sulfurospirillum diekertiae TaxID=1854492 RepID=A0A1Y0HPW7_9BACT|nr:LysE family translocator [Sulfurospirillum diekertiae]ARU49980.1 Homoserine/homoserine lactone efflux protein [Sulfurospirillum diekertiae]ASC94770.1 Homoserine/homoserine lactone efflux protein [Sulfurospirillum diekertiae]